MENSPIGGFFELELPSRKGPLYPEAVSFQSGRAAFLALLRSIKPRRVWIPYYVCSTMIAAIRQAGIDVACYRVDQRLHIADEIRLMQGEWLVYVNYFGIRTEYARSLLGQFDRKSVVIDCTQALFAQAFDCLATIYSPRKFLGVPDGGLLVSSVRIDEPPLIDISSFERSLPLLKRAAFSPEEAYEEHQQAERTLCEMEPRQMSELTRRLLEGVDYDGIREARNRNFGCLHARLGGFNLLQIDAQKVNGALCYPLLIQRPELREFLIKKRIFVPTYWKDVLENVMPESVEASLAANLIPLPCDQRYGEQEMERIVNACLEFFAEFDGVRAPECEAA